MGYTCLYLHTTHILMVTYCKSYYNAHAIKMEERKKKPLVSNKCSRTLYVIRNIQ